MLAVHFEMQVKMSEKVDLENVQDKCNTILTRSMGWKTKI